MGESDEIRCKGKMRFQSETARCEKKGKRLDLGNNKREECTIYCF